MVDTLLLEKAIKDSGLKKSYLAEKLGISIQSLRLRIQNDYDFRSNEVATLCQELNITKLTDKEKIFFKSQ